MRPERPNLTAFVLTSVLVALKRHKRWGALVPDDAIPAYRACLSECMRRDSRLAMIARVPRRPRLWLVERLVAPGYALHMALRKQAVEACARAEIAAGVRQIVVLGAGLDALSLRLSREFPQLHCFELDMPATQQMKQAALSHLKNTLPPNLHFIPCNLALMPLAQVMQSATCFTLNAPTLFIAEGLSMYLTEAENRAWLADCRALAGAGAKVVFTAIEDLKRKRPGEAVRDQMLKKTGDRFAWALARERMSEFLQSCGFSLMEVKAYAELQKPYRTLKKTATLEKAGGEHVFYAVTSSSA